MFIELFLKIVHELVDSRLKPKSQTRKGSLYKKFKFSYRLFPFSQRAQKKDQSRISIEVGFIAKEC